MVGMHVEVLGISWILLSISQDDRDVEEVVNCLCVKSDDLASHPIEPRAPILWVIQVEVELLHQSNIYLFFQESGEDLVPLSPLELLKKLLKHAWG